MPTNPRLAVCSWSLRPTDGANLAAQLEAIGIRRVQIALEPFRDHPAAWSDFPELCEQRGLQMVSGMVSTVGEDYSTMESIKRTGGVVPDATWEQNWKNLQADAERAKAIGLKLVTFHAGYMPHDTSDPQFAKLVERIKRIADLFTGHGIDLGFETGQETAETLKMFLERVNHKGVGVNFDPANILLYDHGDPIAALRLLGPWLKQCHVKDAIKTKVPGTWGEEVRVGTGQVDWKAFFQTTAQAGFQGTFAIEREAGEQRAENIIAAKEYITPLLAQK